jgi:hypothetical protein
MATIKAMAMLMVLRYWRTRNKPMKEFVVFISSYLNS